MRRFSRVADSSGGYVLHRPGGGRGGRRPAVAAVPEGHLPVYVGEEMERYVVSAELLHHPLFVGLLDRSAQEYGYEQPGALRILCSVLAFDRLLRALHDPALLADDHHLLLRLFSSSGDDDDD